MSAPLPRDWQLLSERVCIRAYRFSDLEPFFAIAKASQPEVGRWLPWCHADYGLPDTESWIVQTIQAWNAGKGNYQAVMVDRRDGELLGGIGIREVDSLIQHYGTIGYWLRSDRTGQGLMTEAARSLAEFSLTELALPRVEVFALTDNLASRRVAEKAGFQFEGILRQQLRRPTGGMADCAMYSLLPADLASN